MINQKYGLSKILFEEIDSAIESLEVEDNEFEMLLEEFSSSLPSSLTMSVDVLKNTDLQNHVRCFAIERAIKQFIEKSNRTHIDKHDVERILDDTIHLNYKLPPRVKQGSIAHYLYKILLVDHSKLH